MDSIPFETIDQGSYSAIENKSEYVITKEQDWESLWTDMHYFHPEVPELPLINFTTDIIIAVFRGVGSDGDQTTIRRIVFNETHFVVYVDEKHQNTPMMQIIYPHHIVKITGYPKDLPVEFVYNIFDAF